ncbi:uncharacterized protein LY79DRAFT_161198 [Colletotrichum navitas]|uniref:Uncharacterized protein n=1 Tax=Colletotrichum navitas TaxID=681940 RepID=A0AAD8V6B6_9PEZI|nr:uncharacterized protein LY79DRAFT_161198 [Colletotrichum navitas]KAK1594168.1 hypothetical protein LY79DRAFT_161198 [Colletotrichum navitas]
MVANDTYTSATAQLARHRPIGCVTTRLTVFENKTLRQRKLYLYDRVLSLCQRCHRHSDGNASRVGAWQKPGRAEPRHLQLGGYKNILPDVLERIWGKFPARIVSTISRDARGFLDFHLRDLIYDSVDHATSPLEASRTMVSIIFYVSPQQAAR